MDKIDLLYNLGVISNDTVLDNFNKFMFMKLQSLWYLYRKIFRIILPISLILYFIFLVLSISLLPYITTGTSVWSFVRLVSNSFNVFSVFIWVVVFFCIIMGIVIGMLTVIYYSDDAKRLNICIFNRDYR